jgi:hypothetical protein
MLEKSFEDLYKMLLSFEVKIDSSYAYNTYKAFILFKKFVSAVFLCHGLAFSFPLANRDL